MLHFYPMAKAVSKLAGQPILFDLTEISFLTKTVPSFETVVREIETVNRRLARKNFGVRGAVTFGFELPHVRTENSSARWIERTGNLIVLPDVMTSAPWGMANGTAAQDLTVRDPLGTFNSTKLSDVSGAVIGVNYYQTNVLATSKTGLFSLFLRADVPHVLSIGIQDGITEANDQDVTVSSFWRRFDVRKSFSANAAGYFWAFIRPTRLVASETGTCHAFRADLRHIAPLPDTDEAILADLLSKATSDDWTIFLSLDGGLRWYEALLTTSTRTHIEDKAIGVSYEIAFVFADLIAEVPDLRDGVFA